MGPCSLFSPAVAPSGRVQRAQRTLTSSMAVAQVTSVQRQLLLITLFWIKPLPQKSIRIFAVHCPAPNSNKNTKPIITTVGDGFPIPQTGCERRRFRMVFADAAGLAFRFGQWVCETARQREIDDLPYEDILYTYIKQKAPDTISGNLRLLHIKFWLRQCWAMLSPRFARLLSTRMGPVLGERRDDRPHPGGRCLRRPKTF